MSSVYGYYASSVSSTSSNTSLGVSGLVSGMDIDSTVKAMCSGTSSKISKVQQNLMKLEWKQEAYQDVGSALTDFKEKYLSSTSSTSISKLLSNCYDITSNGTNASAISASGSANIISDFSVLGVSSLATNASYTSKGGVTTNAISTGKLSFSSESTTVSALEGKKFAFKIGSASYSLELGSEVVTDAASAADAINAAIKKYDDENYTGEGYVSLASKINVDGSSGKLELKSTDASSNISISSASNTNVLKAFGLQRDDKGNLKNGTTITAGEADYSASTKQQSFFSQFSSDAALTFDLDGIKASIKFDEDMSKKIQAAGQAESDESKKQEAMLKVMVEEVSDQLSKIYGDKVKVTGNDGCMSFETTSSNSVLSVSSATSGIAGDSGILNGLSVGDANRLLLNKSLEESNFSKAFNFGDTGTNTYDLNVNGVSIKIGKNSITVGDKTTEYKSGVTMNNVMSAVNSSGANVKMSYLSTTDRFTIASTVSGESGKIEVSGSFADMIFGDGNVTPDDTGAYISNGSGTISGESGSLANGNLTKGSDAKLLVSFDGKTVEEITRSTNSFKLDGLSLNLTSTFNADKTAADFTTASSISNCDGAVTFNKTVNADDLTDALKTMVEDYNNLISKVTDYYTTKSDADYQPLTSDMVKDENLSEDQAELYNNKAKEGVLFGDSILRSLSNDMRSIFSGLSSIGIKTSSDYTEYGKLTLDAEKFKSALESDTQSVVDKLTAEKTGSLSKLDDLMKKYVNSSITSPGLITAKSGLKSSSLSQMTCTMYTEKERLEDQLSTLQDKYDTQSDRYYSQFTNMEVQLNKIMSQSSYLGQISF